MAEVENLQNFVLTQSSHLNQYKIPFAVTYSGVFSETVGPIIIYDIPTDPAWNVGGHWPTNQSKPIMLLSLRSRSSYSLTWKKSLYCFNLTNYLNIGEKVHSILPNDFFQILQWVFVESQILDTGGRQLTMCTICTILARGFFEEYVLTGIVLNTKFLRIFMSLAMNGVFLYV